MKVFAPFSAEHQRALAAAYLPAARRGLGFGTGRTQAPFLMRFMTQLLQVRCWTFQQAQIAFHRLSSSSASCS
jgi:hypothetical protein